VGIVKAPCYSMEVSGNVGDICFSRMPSGAVVRSAWTGTQTSTGGQLTQRAYLTAASQAWSGTLTKDQREKWRKAAMSQVRMNRLQIKYVPNGYQYYMQLAIQGLVSGGNVVKEPPILAGEVQVTNISVSVRVGYLQVYFYYNGLSGWERPIGSDAWQLWQAGGYDGEGRHPIEGEWRMIQSYVTSEQAKDYTVVSNKWYWYRCRWVLNDGRVGNYWMIQKQYT